MSSPGSLLLFCIAEQQDTFGATTKVTHLRSLVFRQPDGVNCVVRRVSFEVCPKTEYCS